MDLKAVSYAVTLSEELHFGRAARRHYISQQPFGQRIRQLERDLGFPLFERTSRRVSLTPRGEMFVLRAREVLAHFDELRRAGLGRSEDDALVIGVLGFGLADLWTSARQVMRRQAPSLQLLHRDLDLVSQHRLVRSGEVDAGIVFYLGPVEGLVFDIVSYSPRVAVVPTWSELAERDFLSLADLDGERWLPTAAADSELATWLGPAAARPAGAAVRRPDAIASAVATTGMVGLHAAAAARHYPHPSVRYVPMEGAGCPIAVATRKDDDRPGVQALRRVVLAALELAPAAASGIDQNEFA